MSEINVVKQLPLELTEAESAVMRKVMFQAMNGLDEDDKRAWTRFWRMVMSAQVGEIFSIETWFPRHGAFHRLHMKIETTVFQSQERIKRFESFRDWLKVGAGFVEWLPGPRGGVIPIPKSISYKKCDDEEMRTFHANAISFLREPHAQKVLWPHLSPEKRAEMMETVLGEFER